jgi:hypothetical protein
MVRFGVVSAVLLCAVQGSAGVSVEEEKRAVDAVTKLFNTKLTMIPATVHLAFHDVFESERGDGCLDTNAPQHMGLDGVVRALDEVHSSAQLTMSRADLYALAATVAVRVASTNKVGADGPTGSPTKGGAFGATGSPTKGEAGGPTGSPTKGEAGGPTGSPTKTAPPTRSPKKTAPPTPRTTGRGRGLELEEGSAGDASRTHLRALPAKAPGAGGKGSNTPKLTLKYGRVDANCSVPLDNVVREMPDAREGRGTIKYFTAIGMTPRQAVALIGGAHSLGRAGRKYSGFEGVFVPGSEFTLSNQFFQQIMRPQWRQVQVGKVYQWALGSVGPEQPFLLNSDVALAYDIEPIKDQGGFLNSSCATLGLKTAACAPSATHRDVLDFQRSNQALVDEFGPAFQFILDLNAGKLSVAS